MGDFFERIIDIEVTAEAAGALADQAVDWMVAEGLITRETSSIGMYSLQVDKGYKPGPNWEQACADREDPLWRPGPVAVIVGRDQHVGGQGSDEADSATCPRCDARTVIINYPEEWEPDEEAWQPFSDAIESWKETGDGSVTCPSCGASVPVTEWRFGSGFTLGTLAFDFWGWPPLNIRFHAEMSARLGHTIETQTGKF
ncbi:hypothetical protein [Nonomuraea maritima]|uniref:hypothetical protein n=1 Tax=Nonomuraea maritima TaxID=683260 RepID=UPI003712CE62